MTNSITKTKGVVLSTVPYNDRTQFVRIYTEQLGKVTCKVTLSRVHRNGGQRLLYAPLTVLELVLEGRIGQDFKQIQEATLINSPYTLSMSDPGKAAQCLYMAELLDKTVKEVEANARLWQFVSQSVELLQLTHSGSANFHLVFTTRLCYHIGFQVDNTKWREGDAVRHLRGRVHHWPYLSPTLSCGRFRQLAASVARHAIFDARLAATDARTEECPIGHDALFLAHSPTGNRQFAFGRGAKRTFRMTNWP